MQTDEIKNRVPDPALALVLQCFVKADTLKNLLKSLLDCAGINEVDLIFWCDSPIKSRNEARYSVLTESVSNVIDSFVALNSAKFRSVIVKRNDLNEGTCKTCELAVTYAFSNHSEVVFVEDDVIFSRDAIRWFQVMLKHEAFKSSDCWAVTGEAVFFNAQEKSIPSGWENQMRELALSEGLHRYYTTHEFVPSTCFATNREKWEEFGKTRGQPLGDVDVCNRCKDENKHSVFPIVPRVKDIGMLHEDGFSVSIHTAGGVTEIKNTYLLAEDLYDSSCDFSNGFEKYEGDAGRLYSVSTLLSDI